MTSRAVERRRRRLEVELETLLLVVAAVAYSGVLLEAAVGYPLDPRRAYLSELAASDQPTRWLFRGADLLAGVCVVVSAVALWSSARPGRTLPRWRARAPRWTLAAAAVFGGATVVDALVPLPCAQAGSATCAADLARGGGGLQYQVHLASSSVANLAAVGMSLGLLVLAVAGRRQVRPTAARVVTGVVAACAVLLTLPVAVLSVLEELGTPTSAHLGLFQRGQTVAFCLGLAVLGKAVTGFAHRTTTPAPVATEPHRAGDRL